MKNPKLLLKFKPGNRTQTQDPNTGSVYVAIPKEGVEVGWAVDRMLVVKEGDIIGFRFPRNAQKGEDTEYVGRALSIAIKDGCGHPLEEPHLNVMVWGPELDHAYMRFVHPSTVYWRRDIAKRLDRWFFNAPLDFNGQDMLLRLMHYGAFQSNFSTEYLHEAHDPGSAPFIYPPKHYRCIRSVFLKYNTIAIPRLINRIEEDLESFLLRHKLPRKAHKDSDTSALVSLYLTHDTTPDEFKTEGVTVEAHLERILNRV